MKFSVFMLLNCILYCDAGPSCLQVQYGASYHGYHNLAILVFVQFFFRNAVALHQESFMFV